MRDGKRAIFVCEGGQIWRNEVGSPHGAEGVEYTTVNHSLRPNHIYKVVNVMSRHHSHMKYAMRNISYEILRMALIN
jgi:ribosomal protein L35AE/L33A